MGYSLMLYPALDLTCILRAGGIEVTTGSYDYYVGATLATPQTTNKNPLFLDVPIDSIFIDMGTAFSPTRFMGQANEIRYARALLHLRASDPRKGREVMIGVMNFLLGKKLYVHPGKPTDPKFPRKLDDPDPRVVWHELDIANPTDVAGKITALKHIAEKDTTRLEYLDVYTTSSEPIHSGPDRKGSHFFTTTYNMVYNQAA